LINGTRRNDMLRIIRASPGQLDTVLTLVERLLTELSGNSGEHASIDRDLVRPQLLEAPDRFLAFLAVDERDTPLGVVTLTEAIAAYAGGKYGIISELYVDPTHRSAGIGRQLLGAVLSQARSKGWARVDVAAPPDSRWDRTVSFYQQNGFVFTGRKLKYLLTTEQGDDAG
jgi:GNAT superfamily N-acetyltransferase